MATTKKAAASPKDDGDEQDTSQDNGQDNAEAQGDEENPYRPGMVIPQGSDKAPIDAPDQHRQHEPENGYADSSTNDTYAAIGGRTIAGEDHVGIETEDGKKVSGNDLFDDDGGDLLTVKQTVVEVFTYANSPNSEERRLLFNVGQTVSRQQAKRVTEAMDAAKQEPTFATQRD